MTPMNTKRVARNVLAVALAVAIAAFVVPPLAGQSQEPVDLHAIYKIKEEGLQRSKVMEITSYLTDVAAPSCSKPCFDRVCRPTWASRRCPDRTRRCARDWSSQPGSATTPEGIGARAGVEGRSADRHPARSAVFGKRRSPRRRLQCAA